MPGWSIFVSGCLDFQGFAAPGSGGLVIAVSPNLNKLCSFEERILVDGRCLLVSLCSNSLGLRTRVHIINLHNFGLSGGQVSDIGQELDQQIRTTRPDPRKSLESFLVISTFYLGMIVSSKLDCHLRLPHRLRRLLLQALTGQLG